MVLVTLSVIPLGIFPDISALLLGKLREDARGDAHEYDSVNGYLNLNLKDNGRTIFRQNDQPIKKLLFCRLIVLPEKIQFELLRIVVTFNHYDMLW